MARKNPVGVAIVGAIVFFAVYLIVKYLTYGTLAWEEPLIATAVVFVAYLIAQMVVNNKSSRAVSVKKRR